MVLVSFEKIINLWFKWCLCIRTVFIICSHWTWAYRCACWLNGTRESWVFKLG